MGVPFPPSRPVHPSEYAARPRKWSAGGPFAQLITCPSPPTAQPVPIRGRWESRYLMTRPVTERGLGDGPARPGKVSGGGGGCSPSFTPRSFSYAARGGGVPGRGPFPPSRPVHPPRYVARLGKWSGGGPFPHVRGWFWTRVDGRPIPPVKEREAHIFGAEIRTPVGVIQRLFAEVCAERVSKSVAISQSASQPGSSAQQDSSITKASPKADNFPSRLFRCRFACEI